MLTKLFNWLFYACKHKWELKEYAKTWHSFWGAKNYLQIDVVVLQYNKCGNIKIKRIK